MVFVAWRPTFWRWYTVKKEFMPRVAFFGLMFALAAIPFKHARVRAWMLPEHSSDSETYIQDLKRKKLDDDKIRILAQRRYDNLKKRAEARAFLHEHGYKPRATNLNFKISDINSI